MLRKGSEEGGNEEVTSVVDSLQLRLGWGSGGGGGFEGDGEVDVRLHQQEANEDAKKEELSRRRHVVASRPQPLVQRRPHQSLRVIFLGIKIRNT